MKKLISAILFVACAMTAPAQMPGDTITLTYRLHGQTRRFAAIFTPAGDGGMRMDWTIERNLRLWRGSYTMTASALGSGDRISYLMPEDGLNATLPSDETFALISERSYRELKDNGFTTINNTRWTLAESPAPTGGAIACRSSEGAAMTIAGTPGFPLITSMTGNPLGIDWTASWRRSAPTPREEIAAAGERSGGIYYAYPYTDDIMPPVPEGYRATHLSHYGRHGSRWIIRDYEYGILIDSLSARRLTPQGDDVLRRVKALAAHAEGHRGELSPVGERQHRGIAERMYRRFPRLMADTARIVAHSSMEPRCIMSMAAFSERLKELNPQLRVERHASPGDMRFISYSNDRARAANADSAAWWSRLAAFRDSVIDPTRLMQALVDEPVDRATGVYLSWLLHDIAVDTQDTEPGVELLDIFTPDELYALWLPLNYKMYYLHGDNPATGGAGPESADSLLRHFVADIDRAIADGPGHRDVTLRFGHDTALLRLMARMHLRGADARVDRPDDYAAHWQDYRLAPMAANLQVMLLVSDDPAREPLVVIRHNERPAAINLPAPADDDLPTGTYRWSTLRPFWLNNK